MASVIDPSKRKVDDSRARIDELAQSPEKNLPMRTEIDYSYWLLSYPTISHDDDDGDDRIDSTVSVHRLPC